MQTIQINYFAVLLGAVLAMVIGGIWYGPLFGKQWMELIGVNPKDAAAKKKMQQGAGPLYGIQFVLTLFQVLVLSHLVADTALVTPLERSLWIWAAFVVPSFVGAIMWTNDTRDRIVRRLLIQLGYQLVLFITFGLVLQLL